MLSDVEVVRSVSCDIGRVQTVPKSNDISKPCDMLLYCGGIERLSNNISNSGFNDEFDNFESIICDVDLIAFNDNAIKDDDEDFTNDDGDDNGDDNNGDGYGNDGDNNDN